MEIKNSSRIYDAYCEQQNKFDSIKEKAKECVKINIETQDAIMKCKEIFEVVFKNFNPERKPLDIYLRRNHYNDTKKEAKWIIGKENIKGNCWYYSELCLNNIGLTLLPTYGEKSFNIVCDDIEQTIYNLTALKDKIPMNKLKEVLKPEKLKLLNRLIENVEILKLDNKYVKPQKLEFFRIDSSYEAFQKEKCKTNFLQLNGDRSYLRCKCMEKKDSVYGDVDFALTTLEYSSSLILEQISEEITILLKEYCIYLEQRKKAVEDHYNNMKEKFIKELICLNLKGQKQ